MLPRLAVHLGLISVVMGTSLHLVADSITRRLLLTGYQLHLSVSENPVMKNLKPSVLVGAISFFFYTRQTSQMPFYSDARVLLRFLAQKPRWSVWDAGSATGSESVRNVRWRSRNKNFKCKAGKIKTIIMFCRLMYLSFCFTMTTPLVIWCGKKT